MDMFAMEDDYEDNQSVSGEFHNGKRKEKLHQSKDDALYGIFAGDTSSDSESVFKKKRQRKYLTKTHDLPKTPNFVRPNQDIVENEKDDASLPSLEVNDNNTVFLNPSLGKMIKNCALERRDNEIEKSEIKKMYLQYDGNLGLKMIAKNGYKGGGLGKYGQGIVEPIEVKLRPKNMGLGFNEHKETTSVPILQEPLDENKVLPLPKEKTWAKQSQSKKKKKDYGTANELLVKKQEHGLNVVHKVIDMRGPEVRVLTSLDNLNAGEKLSENEIQHNVRLLVDLAKFDIKKIDQKMRNEKETVVALQKEKEKLQKDDNRQKKKLDIIEEIDSVLERLSNENQMGKLTLDSLAKSFEHLKKQFPNEYKLYSLSTIGCSFASPLFSKLFQGWDPLINPEDHLDVISLWKDVLQVDEIFDSPYTHLFMEVVFPVIRISITNTWETKHPEPLLRFLHSWERLLPHPALQTVLDNVLMPKLSSAVDSWDPRQDTVPIHLWVHPWVPVLGQKIESLYHTIRIRIESVLHGWNPSDVSAYNMLSPWKNVFDKRTWERIMVTNIFPKLLALMHEFEVNPSDQKLDQFYYFRTWATVIPVYHMLHIMDIFFNKWEEVLYEWLCSKPDYEEVTNWYLGWKDLIPSELLSNEHIRFRLSIGLDMMNQASDGLEVVPPCLRRFEHKQRKSKSFDISKMDVILMGRVLDLSLKDIIDNYAQDNDLVFKPKKGRMKDGHQVYRFGNMNIIIDSFNQKVFAQNEDKWSLVTLEKLVNLGKASVMRRR